MELKECIFTRRSVRRFDARPVPHEVLEQVVAQAAYAPSWKNTQISRYIAIEDRSVLDAICRDFLPEHNANIVSGAPLLIAQTFIKGRSGFERDGSYTTERKDGWQHYDCGIAAQTFCLAAHDAGLGTVIMGIFPHEELGAFLNVPEEQELMALIAVGYPAEQPNAPKRKDVETLLTYR
ncbi:MAG: nitroreductase family protein [Oscillospiraceae bacterium]|nr:nitroreductase family protein [Oscillospiraceae bacterium]